MAQLSDLSLEERQNMIE